MLSQLVAFLVGLGCVLLLAFVVARSSGRESLERRQLRGVGKRVEAQVISARQATEYARGYPAALAPWKFEATWVDPQSQQTLRFSGRGGRRVGSSIFVVYDPADPSRYFFD